MIMTRLSVMFVEKKERQRERLFNIFRSYRCAQIVCGRWWLFLYRWGSREENSAL